MSKDLTTIGVINERDYTCEIALKSFYFLLIDGKIIHMSNSQFVGQQFFLSYQDFSFEIILLNTQQLLKAL